MKPVALLFGLAFLACTPPATPLPDAGDASADLSLAASAKRDCDHLRALKCAGGSPTPDGHACEEVEAAELDAGVPIPWACRLNGETCSAVNDCGTAK